MRKPRISPWRGAMATFVLAIPPTLLGCFHTTPDYTDFARGPAPLRVPSPAASGKSESYEDSLTGGQVFSMYCAECHNPRPLSERPLSNYKNVAVHMRVRANLTGKEYAKLAEFLSRWHDVSSPNPTPEPSPKRLTFSQPISELRDQPAPEEAPAPKPLPQP